MSDIVKPKRAMLWQEGVRLFRQNWREWAKYAVWTFVVMAICQAIMMMSFSDTASSDTMKGITETQKAKKSLTPQQSADIKHVLVESAGWIVPFATVFIVQTYAFIAFFMRTQPGFGSPKASVRGFFCWIWVYIQILLLLFAVGIVVVGIPIGLGFIPHVPIPAPVLVLVAVAGYIFLYFIMLRLMPVIILAVCDVKPLFKVSWTITKGNCWRIFGNLLLFMLIVLGLAIALGLMEGIGGVIFGVIVAITKSLPVSASGGAPPLGFVLFQAVFGAFNMTVFNGVFWAFYCAVTRVLTEEKRQNDPTFVLTTPT